MTLIITDEDVKRLLPMADCIEAMRVAFRDFAGGIAVNRPRVRYLARHLDPPGLSGQRACGFGAKLRHRMRAGRLADHAAAQPE